MSRSFCSRSRLSTNFLVALATTVFLAGCSSDFKEVHYFKSVSTDDSQDRPTNFYRLTITGQSAFSNARYVSGFYDERAVDLFFNEIKSDPENNNAIAKIFEDDQKEPGSDEVIKPLSPDNKNGALVMIFSTNANAVAGAIGSFAENQVVADAVTNLINRSTIKEARAAKAMLEANSAQATAVKAELEALFGAEEISNPATAKIAYGRILSAIANALDPDTHLATFEEAEAWFQARPAE